MKFAKIVFTTAGVWGFLVLSPLYFMLDIVGQKYPPPVTHPDFYYGFLGLAIAWQPRSSSSGGILCGSSR